MAVTYGFFDSVNGDRKYNAEQMSDYFKGIVTEGVFQHVDNGLQVIAGTGMTVKVKTGRAIIQNRWVENDEEKFLAYYGSREAYDAIRSWDDVRPAPLSKRSGAQDSDI